MRLWRSLRPTIYSHARSNENRHPDERNYDVTVLDEGGNVLLDVTGFTLQAVGKATERPQTAQTLKSDQTFCVRIEHPGSLGTLGLRPATHKDPGPAR